MTNRLNLPFSKKIYQCQPDEIFLFIGTNEAWKKAKYFHNWRRKKFAIVLPCDEGCEDMLPKNYNWQIVKNLPVVCYAFINLSSTFIRCLAYELLRGGATSVLFISKNYKLASFTRGKNHGN